MVFKNIFFTNKNKFDKFDKLLEILKESLKESFPYENCDFLNLKNKDICAIRIGLRSPINIVSSDIFRENASLQDIIFIYDTKNKFLKINGQFFWKLLQINENNQITECEMATIELLELYDNYEFDETTIRKILESYHYSDLFDSVGNQAKNVFPSNKLLYEISLIPMFDSVLGNNQMMDRLIFEKNSVKYIEYMKNFKVQDFFYLASTLEYDSEKQNEIFINGITWDDFFKKKELVPLKEMLDICCSQFSDTDMIQFLKNIRFVNFADKQKKYASRSN